MRSTLPPLPGHTAALGAAVHGSGACDCAYCLERFPDPPDWTDAEVGDGRAFAAWLETTVGLERVRMLGESLARSLHRWRHGSTVRVWDVDRVVTPLGYHLSDVDPAVWDLRAAGSGPVNPCQLVADYRRAQRDAKRGPA